MKPFVSILFFASFYRLASSMPKLEDFYVVQIGFKPPKLDHEVISYETCMSKGKPSERTISGNFTFHRRVEELGFFITMKRRTTTNNEVNSGTKVPIYNACKQTKYSVEPFFDKFSAKLDENCSVEPGVYSLSNWSLEEHMKKHINKMVLGEFVFYISWLEGKNVIMQHEAYMDFKGLKEKEAEDKMAGNSVKEARNERRNRDHDQNKDKKGKSSRQH